MPTTYGRTLTVGDVTVSVEGFGSPEEAEFRCYEMLFEDGDWKPRELREKWWQFWRPTEHTEIEKKFVNHTEN